MKKLMISGFALAALLLAAGGALAIHEAVEAKAEGEQAAVVALLGGYMTEAKTYTKKTQIFLNEDTRTEWADVFHAGHNVLERTTYYDETTNALLMGDYDGGFDSINSGYRTDGDNMKHYTFAGDASNTGEYFTNVTDTYTVPNTNVNKYFVNLTTLSTHAGADGMNWTTDGSSYYYNFTDIALKDDGDFNDPFLKDILYFTAPMLLQRDTAYFTPDYVQIKACTDWLAIRLYVSSTDSGKLTVYDDGNGLLSEARIFRGLVKEETSRWELRGGWSSGGWTFDSYKLTYYAHIREMEQYCLKNKFISKQTAFKVYDNVDFTWYGASVLESDVYNLFYQEGDSNMKTINSRTYDFYWKGSTKKLWVSSSHSFQLYLGSEFAGYPQIGIYTWCDGWTTEYVKTEPVAWPGVKYASASSLNITINGLMNKLIIAALDADGNKQAQTVDIDITDNFTTCQVSNDKDEGGKNTVVIA